MSNDRDIIKTSFIKRRVALIETGYAFLTFVLIIKLFKLQILEGLFYKRKSNNNSLRKEFILPKRGVIYDRNMKEIATNITGHKLVFFNDKRTKIEDLDNVLKILKRPKKKTDFVYSYIKRKLKQTRNQKFVLARNLTSNEITRLKFNNVYNNKIDIEQYNIRKYPYKTYTSSLIGYVISIRGNTDDVVAKSNVDYKIGAEGVEKIMENEIGGKVGMKYKVINALGAKVNEISVNEEKNGQKIITTIDQELQNALSRMMDGKNGCATVLDVNTGAILAMVSTPNIDPNLMSVGVSDEEWSEITSNIEKKTGLFTNKNITATYPPGSTFKIVSSLAGLIKGIDPKKKYKCTGFHKVGNRIYHCYKWRTGGHGYVDMDMAIAQSCNCYFYNLSQQISEEDLYKVAIKLGLGEKHLQNFSQEVEGIIPNARWKKNKIKEMWFPGDTANMSIGQGYTSVTPLQLAVMVARLASNKKIEPVYLLDDEKDNYFSNLRIKDEYIDIVKHGLFSVVNEEYGLINGIVSKKYQVCGKTGSAQIVSQMIDNKDMKSVKVAIEKHSHALFVGFAPYDNPRYAVSVVVEHGIGGAYSAAPIGTRILVEAIKNETK